MSQHTPTPTGTGQLSLRVTTYPAPAPRLTYRQLVVGLCFSVARLPAERLADDLEAYGPLRFSLGTALAVVEPECAVLYGALLRLLRCIDDVADGRMPAPDRLALALAGVVRAIGDEPAGKPSAATVLERVPGNVAALSGRLVAAR